MLQLTEQAIGYQFFIVRENLFLYLDNTAAFAVFIGNILLFLAGCLSHVLKLWCQWINFITLPTR